MTDLTPFEVVGRLAYDRERDKLVRPVPAVGARVRHIHRAEYGPGTVVSRAEDNDLSGTVDGPTPGTVLVQWAGHKTTFEPADRLDVAQWTNGPGGAFHHYPRLGVTVPVSEDSTAGWRWVAPNTRRP